jgi:hypothetical protein
MEKVWLWRTSDEAGRQAGRIMLVPRCRASTADRVYADPTGCDRFGSAGW